MEFYDTIFEAWKVMKLKCGLWKVLEKQYTFWEQKGKEIKIWKNNGRVRKPVLIPVNKH